MRNKTKFLLISALSLCTLSAGVTAVMASAENEPVQENPFSIEYAGASIRLDGEAGIRFAVQMSVEDWNEYSEQLAKTWVTISDGKTTSEDFDTSDKWYTVNDAGEYVTEGFTKYQATVVLYEIPTEEYTTEFTVKGYAQFKETQTVVDTKKIEARSMSYVAKEYAGTDAGKIEAVKEYMYYTVTLESEGETFKSVTVPYGTEASALEQLGAPEKTGYIFTGWTYENGDAVEAGDTVTGDVTVYATFEQDLTPKNVDFNVNFYLEKNTLDGYTEWTEASEDYPAALKALKAQEGTAVNLEQDWAANLTSYVPTGYTLDLTNENGIVAIADLSETNNTLKIYFNLNRYDVTYTATNATLSTASETVAYGNKATAPTLTPNAGYEWNGVWNNGMDAYNFETPVTGALNLTATVTPITYTVTYTLTDANGYTGNSDGDNVETYTVETDDIILVNASSDDYDFVGWFDEDGNKVEKIEKGSTGNIELTAKWAPRMGVTNVWTYDVNTITVQGTTNSKEVVEIQGRTAFKYVNGTWSTWTFVDVPFSAGLDIDVGDTLSFEYLICKNSGSEAASTYNLRFMKKGAKDLLGGTMTADNVPQNVWNSVTWTVTDMLVNAGGIRLYFEIVNSTNYVGFDAYVTNMTVTKSTLKTKVADVITDTIGITPTSVVVTPAQGEAITDLNAMLTVGTTYTIEGLYVDNGVTKAFKEVVMPKERVVNFDDNQWGGISVEQNYGTIWKGFEPCTDAEAKGAYSLKVVPLDTDNTVFKVVISQAWRDSIDPATDNLSFDLCVNGGSNWSLRGYVDVFAEDGAKTNKFFLYNNAFAPNAWSNVTMAEENREICMQALKDTGYFYIAEGGGINDIGLVYWLDNISIVKA